MRIIAVAFGSLWVFAVPQALGGRASTTRPAALT